MEFRKDNMSNYCKNCYELQEQLDKLKAENKKLDHELYMAIDEGRAWIEKYKQTLAEIKEIARDTIDMFYDGLDTGTTYDRVEQILQKISEVEEWI